MFLSKSPSVHPKRRFIKLSIALMKLLIRLAIAFLILLIKLLGNEVITSPAIVPFIGAISKICSHLAIFLI